MPKLLFIIGNMKIGGIQKSLLELTKTLCDEGCEVSLFCLSQSGELLSKLDKRINLYPQTKLEQISEHSLKECLNLGFGYGVLRLVFSALTKIGLKKLAANVYCKLIGSLGQYDAAISFSQPIRDSDFCTLTNEVALYSVSAEKKLCFIHCDFLNYGGNSKYNRELLCRFDKIAAVSNSVGNRLLEAEPKLNGKVFTVKNIIDKEDILKKASIDSVKYNKKAIVSVCRLSEEKGVLRIPEIIKRVKDCRTDFEYHIVGGGPLKEKLQKKISELNLEDTMFLDGETDNPYRFMKNASFLLVPSYHEAAPIVFKEARVLSLPVLTTDTLSAAEIVKNSGIICENTDSAIEEMLKTALIQNYTFDFSEDADNSVHDFLELLN